MSVLLGIPSNNMCVCIHTYICVCMYTYMYVYTHVKSTVLEKSISLRQEAITKTNQVRILSKGRGKN